DESLDSFPYEFYIKLERNLKLIPKISDESIEERSKDKNKLCFYLKYWFYDQVITKGIKNTQITQLLKIWQQNKIKKCTECECELDVKSLNDINGLKKIYDYYLFLELYKDKNIMSHNIYNKDYCKYLEDARASYKLLYISRCSKNNANDVYKYCNEFIKHIMPYDDIDMEFSISCEADNITEEEVKILLSSSAIGVSTENPSMIHGLDKTNQHMSNVHSNPISEDTSRKTSAIISVSSVGIGFILFLLYKVKELLF
ncbi:CYIR protein, partial [Plasmodium cynomolgi strain B]